MEIRLTEKNALSIFQYGLENNFRDEYGNDFALGIKVMDIIDEDDHYYGKYWISFQVVAPNYIDRGTSDSLIHYCMELKGYDGSSSEFLFEFIGWPKHNTMRYNGFHFRIPGNAFCALLSIYVSSNANFRHVFSNIFGLKDFAVTSHLEEPYYRCSQIISSQASQIHTNIKNGTYLKDYINKEIVVEICNWILPELTVKKRSDQRTYSLWMQTEKSLNNEVFHSIVYNCALTLQHFYPFNNISEETRINILNLVISLLEFTKKHINKEQIESGINYWKSVALVYRDINRRDLSIKIIEEGIEVIGELTKWKPGSITSIESNFSIYSQMEYLYLIKGICLNELSRKNEAKKCLALVKDSLSKRGLNDMKYGLLPNGLIDYINKTKE